MPPFSRYHRQMLLPEIGEAGQERLRDAHILLIGCGALGSVIADALTRAGVGQLTLVDRDLVELTNLQRQILYTEEDAAESVPKAVAAARELRRINSQVWLHAVTADFNPLNALELARGCDLLLDGTDNFPTRLLINDLAVQLGIPYVYGGVIGTRGMVYPVLPRTADGDAEWESMKLTGPCLRCLFEHAPPLGGPTCDTAGVLGPAASVVANIQSAEALKILMRDFSAVRRSLLTLDLWDGTFRSLNLAPGRHSQDSEACPCCGQRRFEYLDQPTAPATTLCGRNAVQITRSIPSTASSRGVDLHALADRLAPHGSVQANDFLLRATLPLHDQSLELTLFPDGRAIVHGTEDPAVADTFYDRYVGS